MNGAIVVIAYNRPDYLYITLGGIFSAVGFAGWDVYVFFDGNSGGGFDVGLREKQICAIGGFPIVGARFRKVGAGMFNNVMDSFRETFVLGYDFVLLVEEDNLLAVDALKFLEVVEKNSFFYTLLRCDGVGDKEHRVGVFSPQGLMISRESFECFDRWVKSGVYWGLNWPGEEWRVCDVDNVHYVNYDGIFDAIVKQFRLSMVVPPRSLIAHFGVMGFNQNCGDISEFVEAHNEMVNGSRNEWLPRLADKLYSGDYSDNLEKRLFPRGFDYYGDGRNAGE